MGRRSEVGAAKGEVDIVREGTCGGLLLLRDPGRDRGLARRLGGLEILIALLIIRGRLAGDGGHGPGLVSGNPQVTVLTNEGDMIESP